MYFVIKLITNDYHCRLPSLITIWYVYWLFLCKWESQHKSSEQTQNNFHFGDNKRFVWDYYSLHFNFVILKIHFFIEQKIFFVNLNLYSIHVLLIVLSALEIVLCNKKSFFRDCCANLLLWNGSSYISNKNVVQCENTVEPV